MDIEIISTTNAPTPGGHYSQAVSHGGLVFVAGQLSIDAATGEWLAGSIEEQTERALRNIEAVLGAAGSDLSRVLKMTVYVSDMDLWDAVNTTYARVMGAHRPARAIIPTGDLHNGMLIEIDAVAAVG